MLKEFEWIENFINKYKDFLKESERESVYNYCMGSFHYVKANYEKSREYLLKSNSQDVLFNLIGKNVLLKVYYHLQDFESVDHLIESMSKYLSRKEIVGYHRDIYKNTLSCFKKLISVNPFDRKDREKLKEEIQNTNPIAMKAWLIEQVDTMG